MKKVFIAALIGTFITTGSFIGNEVQASCDTGWEQTNGTWYYYDNGIEVKNGWVADSKGWCYLDSQGCWVDHAAMVKDSLGYCIIGDDGYWTGQRQEPDEMSAVEVAKNVASIVLVEASDSSGNVYTRASGCIASSDGKIITNYHIIQGASSVKVVLQDGTAYDIEGLLGFSRDKDVAILKLKNAKNLTPVILGDSDTIQLGEQILTIGNPGGYTGTVSEGIVSGLHRLNLVLRKGEDFQISAPITSGSSGGGVFNMTGQVVGITYAGISGTGNLNFAIPINEVKPFLLESSVTQLKNINIANP